MEREIKFRVINQDGSIIGYEFCNADGWFFTLAKELNEAKRAGIITAPFEQKHIRLQYTGLKDKNGKDVFEGDILRWRCSKSGSDKVDINIVTIEWAKGAHGYSLTIHKNGEKWATQKSYWNSSEREVIGNIYETPEILNQ